MKILLVAATPPETAIIRTKLRIEMQQNSLGSAHFGSYQIDLLHTGIGMVNTAYQLGAYLAKKEPELAINLGIAGSFDRNLSLGEVVEVRTEIFAELGAQDGSRFLSLKEMDFPLLTLKDQTLYTHLHTPHSSPFDLPELLGITVNTVHGDTESIARTSHRWSPDIETMEGGAFFHAFLQKNTPFYQIRGISNYVEKRDKSKWNIPIALKNVQEYLLKILKESIL